MGLHLRAYTKLHLQEYVFLIAFAGDAFAVWNMQGCICGITYAAIVVCEIRFANRDFRSNSRNYTNAATIK